MEGELMPCETCGAALVTHAENGEVECVNDSEHDNGWSRCDSDELEEYADAKIAEVSAALRALDQVLSEIVDRDTLASLLMDLRDVKKQAGDVFATCERRLLNEAGERSFDVPMLGRFEVRRSTKRTGWVWDRLIPDLIAKAREERRYNSDSGEVEGEGEATARVLRDCVSFSSAKVTGLRARGLSDDDYCTVEEGAYSVMLPARTDFDAKAVA